MVNLDVSQVHQNLDAKFKIGSLEAFDLILSLVFSAVMNLFFSGTALEIPTVIVGPVVVMAILYFGKKGKPENHIVHFVRYYLDEGFFSSGEEPGEVESMRNRVDG